MKNTMEAMLVIDYVNDIIHPEGKLAQAKGYGSFEQEYGVLDNVKGAIARAQDKMPVIYVGVGFEQGYTDQPKDSPLFGKAHEFGVLQKGTWGTQFHDSLPVDQSTTFVKNRVSAFHDTGLHKHLQQLGVTQLYVCGVATDLAVEAAVRDAHDRDYQVNVLADCCVAANRQDHDNSLALMQKLGRVDSYKSLL